MRDELEVLEKGLEREVLALLATRPRELEDTSVLRARVQESMASQTTPHPVQWPVRYVSIAVALVVAIIGIRYLPNVSTASSPLTKTYTTAPGQRATITLADGSKTILAPATTMRVTGRNIELNGEAIFTVVPHADNPFTVRTGRTVTRVLGTTFGVRAYDSTITVAVSDGRVSINNATLSARDAATVRGDTTSVIRNANIASMLSWTSGRLTFDRVPAADVATELERWFGIEIQLNGEQLTEQLVTVVLEAGRKNEAVDLFASLINARVITTGSKITLTPISQ